MTELDDAMRAVDEWAEKKCRACGQQRQLALYGYRFEGLQRLTTVTVRHTCHEYKARAKRLAVAVIGPCQSAACKTQMYGSEEWRCQSCATRAELDRHWPEKEDTMKCNETGDSGEKVL